MKPCWIQFLVIQASISYCAFTNPGLTVSWEAGENQTVAWSTKFETYTVALWQQMGKGNAQTSPNALLYTTPGGGLGSQHGEFDWTVQLYDFDLNVSKQFFLWICEGVNSHPCTGTKPNMPSSYFSIREAEKNPAVTSTESATTSSPTTHLPTSTPSMIQSSVPTITDPPRNTATSHSSPDPSPGHTNSPTGLSTGSVAGIAVACTVVAVAATGALILWYRYLQQKKQHIIVEQQQRSWYGQEPSHPPHPAWSAVGTTSSWDGKPAEMSMPTEPIELYAGSHEHGYGQKYTTPYHSWKP